MNSPPSSSLHLEIPPHLGNIVPALDFIDSYAGQLGIQTDRRGHLKKASGIALETVVKSNVKERNDARIDVDIFENQGNLIVEVVNHGVPIFFETHSSAFKEASQHLDRLSIENLGRKGQTVVMEMRLGEEAVRRALGNSEEAEIDFSQSTIEVRELRPGEEESLSRLFYFIYGYDYINEFVYYPEKLRALREEKKLISIVATTDTGRMVAHVGLLKCSEDPPVYEPCLGVVDPRVKARRLFSQVFERTMEEVKKISMQYLLFDFVTNHDYTQRFVSRYHQADLALFVGCQSKQTQAKLERLGIGEDPKEMDRYSLLFSVIPEVAHPFGEEICLPNNIGELLGFLLEPLHVKWRPASRFQLLPALGKYQTQLQPSQNAVVFDLFAPGRTAVDQILAEWRQLLRGGYQYGAVEVSVAEPGLGNLYDILSKNGFFVAGFVPYHYSRTLGIRFQSIGPTKVAFDEIKVHTQTAKKLLQIVRQNYERNGLL